MLKVKVSQTAYAVLCLLKLPVIFSNSLSFSQPAMSCQGLCCYNTLNYFSVKFCIAPCGCPGSVGSSLETSTSEFWMTSHFPHLISHFPPPPRDTGSIQNLRELPVPLWYLQGVKEREGQDTVYYRPQKRIK